MMEAIRKAIEVVDIAGLGDFSRRNWYPASAEDLLAAAAKLESSEKEIRAMLERTGFACA
jgi:FADH2 O2-dependent halogenase